MKRCFKQGNNNEKWGPADVVPVKNMSWYIGGWCSL